MPSMVNIITVPTRVPASREGKYSRTMIAYDGTMPPWKRPKSAEMTNSETSPSKGRNRSSATPPARSPGAGFAIRRCGSQTYLQKPVDDVTRASPRAFQLRGRRRSPGPRNRRRCAPGASTSPRSTTLRHDACRRAAIARRGAVTGLQRATLRRLLQQEVCAEDRAPAPPRSRRRTRRCPDTCRASRRPRRSGSRSAATRHRRHSFQLAQMATAMPRRRVNQSEVSAISGANIAALPRSPINTPCASENVTMLAALPAITNPTPRPMAPIRTGTMTPNRSARRPMKRPPTPKPIMVSA